MSWRYDVYMEKPGDVGRKIDAHLKSPWGRTFLCTTQEVRESITVSLLGIRTRMQSPASLAHIDARYLLKRCDDVLDQVRVLIRRHDRRHAKTFIRIVRGYQRSINGVLESMHDHRDPRGIGGEGESRESGE